MINVLSLKDANMQITHAKLTKLNLMKLEKAILVYVFILRESNRELKLNYEFKKNFEN